MSAIGYPELNRRGNYICPYCDHKSWKRSWQAAYDHIHREHAERVRMDELARDLDRAKAKNDILQAELEKAKKQNEPPKYAYMWTFCDNCLRLEWLGMPIGIAYAFVRHSCGQAGGMHPVSNANEFTINDNLYVRK